MSRLDDLKALLGDLDPTASLTLSALGLDGTDEPDEGEEQDEDFDEAELDDDEEDDEQLEPELKGRRVRRTKGDSMRPVDVIANSEPFRVALAKGAEDGGREPKIGEIGERIRAVKGIRDPLALALINCADRDLPASRGLAKWDAPAYDSWCAGLGLLAGDRIGVLKAAASVEATRRATIGKADAASAGPVPQRQRGESAKDYDRRYQEFRNRVAAMYGGER